MPTTANNTRTFEQLLAAFPGPVQALAHQTRDLVRELIPDAIETVDGSGPFIGYGFSTGYKGQACTILVSKKEVKLGIVGGAALPDPKKLLEGSGKVHRYIRMTSAADLRRPGVKALVAAAEGHARIAVKPPSSAKPKRR